MPNENASPAEMAMRLEIRIAEFANRCLNVAEALPKSGTGVGNFKDQLTRSATSVAANYSEANAPESRRDFASKIAKALKEARECRTWLYMISKRGFFPESRLKPLMDEANSIIRILSASARTARQRIAQSSAKDKACRGYEANNDNNGNDGNDGNDDNSPAAKEV